MATKWACVGPGTISRDFFTAIKNCLPAEDHEFVAVGSRELARAQKFAADFQFKKAYGSYDELAQDPDVEVVYIGTIPITQAELSIKMLEAGKHVLCETPMTLNLKHAKRVFEAARKNKRIFVQGLWHRWLPAHQQIMLELEAGTLGDIRLVQASLCVSAVVYDKQRLLTASLGGGGIETSLYLYSLACMIFKEMPESITAVGHLSEAGDRDVGCCVILKYKNGAMANLTYHMDTHNGNWSADIMGTKGSIKIPPIFNAPDKITTPAGTQEFQYGPGEYTYPNNAGLAYEAAAIRKTILSGRLENELCTMADSEMIMTISDEVRRQIGLKYPDFD